MVSCAACGCSKTPTTKQESVSFHHFPTKPEVRTAWIQFVNKENWVPTKTSVLCSKHFSEECFDRSSISKTRLKVNAKPTKVIHRMKYVRKYAPVTVEEIDVEQVPDETAASALVASTSGTTTIDVREVPGSPPRSMKPIADENTPRKMALKRQIAELSQRNILQAKIIRTLQKQSSKQKKRISKLSNLVSELKVKILLGEDYSEALL